MISNHGYLMFQAERTKTRAEQRVADDQLGRRAAAVTPLFRSLSRSLAQPGRGLRRRLGATPSARSARSARSAADGGC